MARIEITITIDDLAAYIKEQGLIPVLATDPQGFCDMLVKSYDTGINHIAISGKVIQ